LNALAAYLLKVWTKLHLMMIALCSISFQVSLWICCILTAVL